MLNNDPGNILIQSAIEMRKAHALMDRLDNRIKDAARAAREREFDQLIQITAAEDRLIRMVRSRLAVTVQEIDTLRKENHYVTVEEKFVLVERILIRAQSYLDIRQKRVETQKVLIQQNTDLEIEIHSEYNVEASEAYKNFVNALKEDYDERVELQRQMASYREKLIKEYQESRNVLTGTIGITGYLGAAGLTESSFWYASIVAVLAITGAIISYKYFQTRIRAVEGDKRAQAKLLQQRNTRMKELKTVLSNLVKTT